jgi:cytochrome b561
MELFAIIESLGGFAVFIVAALIARPLWRLYQLQPQPALLRSEVTADLILLAYFVTILMSLVVGVHGMLV